MDERVRKVVLEIGELVKQLPPGVQEKAFEMLLTRELRKDEPDDRRKDRKDKDEDSDAAGGGAPPDMGKAEDLRLNDLPIKARKFLERQDLSVDHINQLFYKENSELKPLYEDLKTTKTSESQIRLALLTALRNGLERGEFEFNGEAVRQQCQLRKCYDAGNFATNFKNNSALFDNFSSYEKGTPLRLSEAGRKQLADLIKELQ